MRAIDISELYIYPTFHLLLCHMSRRSGCRALKRREVEQNVQCYVMDEILEACLRKMLRSQIENGE